ncbi:hypothetical protein AVR91_0204125 [Amycolatopsis keratiniphila subsp. keratiniphila]|uniref:ATP-binding protein n=1 Tax=Amycolatopsis keratiniphila subsp. keratiniphila TaxID=227715 RepID=A0A1W2M1Z7_9PSEU|nr:hypothetical protein AVR91_0204125 [Amycolatopsis keratiniphila subsp. keratiniphila]
MLIAAPGTGKSTWCRDRAELGAVLSTDRARAEIGTGEEDQAASAAAFDLVQARAADHLAAGRDVTIDATGAHPRDRARWRALAAEHGAAPVAVRLRCSLLETLRRNRSRPRRVPALVVVRMWWTVRTLTRRRLRREGFAEVYDVAT